MKKKKTIKYLRKQAEKLWKKVVLKKYQSCFVCGSKSNLLAHHFVPQKMSLALRYDPENGIVLCKDCHFAFHKKSDPFIPFIIAFKKGKQWIEYLQKKKSEKVRPTKEWYCKQIKNLLRYEI